MFSVVKSVSYLCILQLVFTSIKMNQYGVEFSIKDEREEDVNRCMQMRVCRRVGGGHKRQRWGDRGTSVCLLIRVFIFHK